MEKKFTTFLVLKGNEKLELAHELVSDDRSSPQILHQLFSWVTKSSLTTMSYWTLYDKFFALPNFLTLAINQNLLVQAFPVLCKNVFFTLSDELFQEQLISAAEKVFTSVMAHVTGKVDQENYYKFVTLIVWHTRSKSLYTNHVAISLLYSALLRALDMVVGGKDYKLTLSNTTNLLLTPLLDLRVMMIEELNQTAAHSRTTDQKEVTDSDVTEALESDLLSATALVKAKHKEQQDKENQTTAHQFHSAKVHATLNSETVNGIIHAYASSKIRHGGAGGSVSNGSTHGSLPYRQLVLSLLELIETTLFFGLFHPEKIMLSTYGVNIREKTSGSAFANIYFYFPLEKLLQNSHLSGIVGQGLGFLLALFNTGLNIKGNLSGQKDSGDLDSWKQKPLAHRYFLNVFHLLTTTNVRATSKASEAKETHVATNATADKSKRKREDEPDSKPSSHKKQALAPDSDRKETEDAGKGQKKFVAKVSQLSAIYSTLVYRSTPDNMAKLGERMRSFASLMRAAGAIGNWRIQDDEWFVNELNRTLDTTFDLLMASHSASLNKEQSLVLDAAYDVFVGLQSLQHLLIKNRLPALFRTMARGVPVPCCDELLGELIDFCAAARQYDALFGYLFEALRAETNFTPVYLAPKAVQKLSMHISSLNAQIPPIWNLFLDEWKKSDYHKSSKATQRRARFLYLFASFIRSIQFLTTVGYTMDVLYDLFDRTLLVAKQSVEEFEPEESEDSENLLRSIISFHSAIIIIARRINPFREGKSDEVMKRNEKILRKAFPKLLKYAKKLNKSKGEGEGKGKGKQLSSGMRLAMSSLMVSRLRDVGADAPETCFVESKDNSEALQEIRSFVAFIMDARPALEHRKCSCSSKGEGKLASMDALSPLDSSIYSFVGVSESEYPVAHWELITKNIKWIYGYATPSEVKSVLAILFDACSCFSLVPLRHTIGSISCDTLSRAYFYEIWPVRELSGEVLIELVSPHLPEESLPKAHKKLYEKLQSHVLDTSKTKNASAIFKEAIALVEKGDKIDVPNWKEHAMHATIQLGMAQLMPHRWLGRTVASRLCYAAMAWEVIASLSTGGGTEPLLLSSRSLLLNVGTEFRDILLELPDSVAKWIVTLPSALRMNSLSKMTNNILGICLVACIEREIQDSVHMLDTLVSYIEENWANQPDIIIEQIAVTLQSVANYCKTLSKKRKIQIRNSTNSNNKDNKNNNKNKKNKNKNNKNKHNDNKHDENKHKTANDEHINDQNIPLTPLPKRIIDYLLRLETVLVSCIANTSNPFTFTPSSSISHPSSSPSTSSISYFTHLTWATSCMLQVLTATTTTFSIPDTLQRILLPSLAEKLPSFVKTVGRSLLPMISNEQHAVASDAVWGAVQMINNFAQLMFHTEREGLSDRFFMLLLSLSMCLSYRASESRSSNDRRLLQTLSRKLYKTIARSHAEAHRSFLVQHVTDLLSHSIDDSTTLFALQATSILSLFNLSALAQLQPLVIRATTSSASKLGHSHHATKKQGMRVYLAALEVCRQVILPDHLNSNYVPMTLSLIPPTHQINAMAHMVFGPLDSRVGEGDAGIASTMALGIDTGRGTGTIGAGAGAGTMGTGAAGAMTCLQCARLMLRLLDVSLPRLRDHMVYFVSCFRSLLKSLSNFPTWAEDRATAYAITSTMMLLFTRLRAVFKKQLEQDVGAIVLDYIELCENATYGKSVNKALTLLQPGIIGLLKLCGKDTMETIQGQAITFGKFTWDQIHTTMQELATNKGKW